MLAVIGSVALGMWTELDHKAGDLDLVGSYKETIAYAKSLGREIRSCYPINSGKTLVIKFRDGGIFESSLTWPDSLAAELHSIILADEQSVQAEVNGFELEYASLNVLYMLKMSHRYLRNAPSFLKTIRDIKKMRQLGAFIPAELGEHYKRRQKEQYSYAHPKLAVSKEQFFNGDGVNYVYDHDSIHEAVKHFEKPAYAYFKPEDSQVMVSREMWDKLPFTTQLSSVLEEAYVLAIERSQIPFPNTLPRDSFLKALEKVCTSITSGWWREFAWEHYNDVLEMYDEEYINKFWHGVKTGVVKPYDANKGMY